MNPAKTFATLVLIMCMVPASFSHHRKPYLAKDDYVAYHRTVSQAEALIVDQNYERALSLYEQLIKTYDFVFLREYKLATQLALQVGHTSDAFDYLKAGIQHGWTMKSIKKNKFLSRLQHYHAWHSLENQYDSLRAQYEKRLNAEIREEVKKMFGKDQRKAFAALLRFSNQARERYADQTFAPHSERQMQQLHTILNAHGYPGEKLIGNNYWASVIISHHNSISKAYAVNDTIYPIIRPKLVKALEMGQLSAYEFAMIETWYLSIKTGRKAYGYLVSELTEAERDEANQLREALGLSSIETINQLLNSYRQTGINPYLPGRVDFISTKTVAVN
jgi:hypothetical protein